MKCLFRQHHKNVPLFRFGCCRCPQHRHSDAASFVRREKQTTDQGKNLRSTTLRCGLVPLNSLTLTTTTNNVGSLFFSLFVQFLSTLSLRHRRRLMACGSEDVFFACVCIALLFFFISCAPIRSSAKHCRVSLKECQSKSCRQECDRTYFVCPFLPTILTSRVKDARRKNETLANPIERRQLSFLRLRLSASGKGSRAERKPERRETQTSKFRERKTRNGKHTRL